jgi:hypothetical protein
MNSPFLFQNIIVLTILIAIFAGCLYLLLSKDVSEYICRRSKFFLVIYRAATTAVFSASSIGLLTGIWLFYTIEINEISRDCWKRTYQWQTIVPEMPHDQVTEILGEPFNTTNAEDGQQAVFCTNPIGGLESGIINFTNNKKQTELKVLNKTPDDRQILENLNGWLPEKSSKTYANYAEIISDSSSFCAFYSLLGLAILSLYPFKMRELSTLRMLYAPLAAILLKAIYDNHHANVWQFELFSVSPLITIILIGWIVRVCLILATD